MSFLLRSHRGRAGEYAGLLRYDDGTPMTLALTDKLRFKVGVPPDAPLVDLLSGASYGSGSSLTITDRGASDRPAAYTVVVSEADSAALVGDCYDAELLLVVAGAPAGADTRLVEAGVMAVAAGMAGGEGP